MWWTKQRLSNVMWHILLASRIVRNEFYRISSVSVFSCKRANTIRTEKVWTRVFSKKEEKYFRFQKYYLLDNTVEPLKCKDLVVTHGSWSFTRINPQLVSSAGEEVWKNLHFGSYDMLSCMLSSSYTVEPLFRGHPRNQGKFYLNGGWAVVC